MADSGTSNGTAPAPASTAVAMHHGGGGDSPAASITTASASTEPPHSPAVYVFPLRSVGGGVSLCVFTPFCLHQSPPFFSSHRRLQAATTASQLWQECELAYLSRLDSDAELLSGERGAAPQITESFDASPDTARAVSHCVGCLLLPVGCLTA